LLDIQSLSLAFGKKLALDSVTLSIRPGEILVVIGPNGAGKTSLVRAISGILPIQKGAIKYADQDLSNLSPSQRAHFLAVVPQARNLPPAFTVYQTVLMGRTPHLGWLGQASSSDHAQVRLALERTQIVEVADRRVDELSGGEQQRVLLARALVQNTSVLLMDEPTTHLDLGHQSALLNLVRQLVKHQQLAALLVLHDLNLAALYGDRIAFLVDGHLEALGTPEQVLNEEKLTSVYKVPVHVIPHPQYGSPLILPNGRINR